MGTPWKSVGVVALTELTWRRLTTLTTLVRLRFLIVRSCLPRLMRTMRPPPVARRSGASMRFPHPLLLLTMGKKWRWSEVTAPPVLLMEAPMESPMTLLWRTPVSIGTDT